MLIGNKWCKKWWKISCIDNMRMDENKKSLKENLELPFSLKLWHVSWYGKLKTWTQKICHFSTTNGSESQNFNLMRKVKSSGNFQKILEIFRFSFSQLFC